jgi:outer membrane receptor protein involved in Fe transport
MAMTHSAGAQSGQAALEGRVRTPDGQPVPFVSVALENTALGTTTDEQGRYHFDRLAAGSYVVVAQGIGYESVRQAVAVANGPALVLVLTLPLAETQLGEVQVVGKTQAQQLRETGYSVEALEAAKVRNRNVDLNRLLNQTTGVQVRETGGMGSDFAYSIHGVSGKAVRFFIDGVPMEGFGSAYRINNLPINLVERVEVYKGVTPVALPGDALGGAVNLVTRREPRTYLDASYSFGSFATHRAALSGHWRQAATGFTTTVHAFHNASANNYPVWGPTIEVAGPDGRPLPDAGRLRRFNDAYQSTTARVEAGFTRVRWADRLLLGLTLTDLDRGIQTGRTMAFVYGEVRYRERLALPSLTFSKQNALVKGLNIDFFAFLTRLRGTTIDTASRKYNWRGEVVSANVQGELGGIRAQKSRYTYDDGAVLTGLTLRYHLAAAHRFTLSALRNQTRRTGSDALALADWTIPLRQPQHLRKHVTGLAYELRLLDGRWTTETFVKNYWYAARATAFDYNGGSERELVVNRHQQLAWGYGLVSSYQARPQTLLKASAESARRLPDALELLGDGNTILNAPGLQPEHSLNVNASVQHRLQRAEHTWLASGGLFFRHTRNLIWLGEADLFGTARHENLSQVQALGAEAEVQYRHGQWLRLTANATYQDLRNRQRLTPAGAPNFVYNDRLRNTPYLLANTELNLSRRNLLRAGSAASIYTGIHYVPEYFLGWPSLGARAGKKVIPTQLVQDMGLEFTTPGRQYVLGIDCRNLWNRQVYDNYLLQTPGRFVSFKVRLFLTQARQSDSQ